MVIGAPMIFGWHREAMKFVKRHQELLSQIAVAYFITAMNLTRTEETAFNGIPSLGGPGGRQACKARGAFILQGTLLPPCQLPASHSQGRSQSPGPAAVGFFGGKLAMYKMKWWQVLFVLIFIQIQQGGSHNMPFIREWAVSLRDLLNQEV